jgi:hypothetical protein
MHEGHGEHMGHGHGEEVYGTWTYYTGRVMRENPVQASAAARTGKHANRTYTNDDVNRVAAKSEPFRKM